MGTSRKLYREQTKLLYKKFCQTWKTELEFQRYQKSQGLPLPEGSVDLTMHTRPSYQVWLKGLEHQRAELQRQRELKSLRAVELEKSLRNEGGQEQVPSSPGNVNLEWNED